MRNKPNLQFDSIIKAFDVDYFGYNFQNPFLKKGKLPRVVTRYGGKGNFYEDYDEYIRDVAKISGAKTFVDCFGGGGTMSMMALLMTDYDRGAPLFDRIIYNDVDYSVYCTFQTVKNSNECDKLIERIIDTPYKKRCFEEAHEIVALLNLQDLTGHIKKNHDYFTGKAGEKEFRDYMRNSQLNDGNIIHILGEKSEKMSLRIKAILLAKEANKLRKRLTTLDVAYYAFIENAMSFNGSGQSFRDMDKYDRCSIDYGRKMYLTAKKLSDISPLLDRLEVTNLSYVELIEEYDPTGKSDDFVWFLDPPYYSITRSAEATKVYKNEFTDQDHADMIQLLSTKKHWLLCGYEQVKDKNAKEWQKNIYRRLDKISGVKKVDLGIKARPSSSKAISEDDPHEILWLRE